MAAEKSASGGTARDYRDVHERCRQRLLRGSDTWRLVQPMMPNSTTIKEDLSGMSPWRALPAIPDYWAHSRSEQLTARSAATAANQEKSSGRRPAVGTAVKSQAEASHGKSSTTTGAACTAADNKASRCNTREPGAAELQHPCPVHVGKAAAKSTPEQGNAARKTRQEVQRSENYTTVTSPHGTEKTGSVGISLQPNELIKMKSPHRSHDGEPGPRTQPSVQAEDWSLHYTPYHLLKQMTTDRAANAAPPSGIELRQQCQQLHAYLFANEQYTQHQNQLQDQQSYLQQQQLKRAEQQQQQQPQQQGYPRHGSQVTPAHAQSSSSVLGSITGSAAVHHFTSSAATTASQRGGQRELGSVQQRPSVASVMVEPCLPAFCSAFDHLAVEVGRTACPQGVRRRVSIPENNPTPLSTWSAVQRAKHAELLQDNAAPTGDTSSGLPFILSQINGRSQERQAAEAREMANERRLWRPAESHVPDKQQQGKARPLQQTCSLVEMSLADSIPQKELARHTSSLINFPVIQTRSRPRDVSIKHQRNQPGNGGGRQVPTAALPQIDGFKFMGDVGGDGSAKSSSVSFGSHPTAKKATAAQPMHRQRPGGRPEGVPNPGRHRQTVKSKPGRLAVEWRAM